MTPGRGAGMEHGPTTIDRYRVDSVIGQGAMGVIYRAYDPEIDRPVAIKLVRTDLLSGEDRDDYIRRFRREAQAAARCVHSGIVAVYDFGLHEGNPFFAMEFVDGSSLAQALGGGARLAADEAVAVILQVLDALGAAHRTGVIHRDIKPANILLLDGRIVKVTDFGISRIDRSDLTGTGTMIGTPSYMSPEQCRGLAIDARSDLFSAGIVLYEMLGGERPFAAPTTTAVVERLLNMDPPDISVVNPAVGPALKAVVERALRKSPEERYQSAAEMATALRAVPASGSDATILSDRTIAWPPALAGMAPAGESARAPRSDATGGSDPTGRFDSDTLATIERSLAGHIGPIARVVLKAAVRTAATPEAFCDLLAANIAAAEERNRFHREALATLRRTAATPGAALPAPGTAGIPAQELERAQTELTRYLGPIARVLVRRKAAQSRSIAELWQLLASDIEREDERGAFLKRGGF
jgi:eukaryotic-like serine/threonine-protein kinase